MDLVSALHLDGFPLFDEAKLSRANGEDDEGLADQCLVARPRHCRYCLSAVDVALSPSQLDGVNKPQLAPSTPDHSIQIIQATTEPACIICRHADFLNFHPNLRHCEFGTVWSGFGGLAVPF